MNGSYKRSRLLIAVAVLAISSSVTAEIPFGNTPSQGTVMVGVGGDGKAHPIQTDNSGNLAAGGQGVASAYILTDTIIGTASTNCYGTGGPALVGRQYVIVKNDSLNTGSPGICFTWDGTTPTISGGVCTHGVGLAVGEPWPVPLPATAVLNCIATAAGTKIDLIERS